MARLGGIDMSEEIVCESGPFTVTQSSGKQWLYHKTTRIATCHSGNYIKRFGGIHGWLRSVMDRELHRVDKIKEQIETLEKESQDRMRLACEVRYSLFLEEMGRIPVGQDKQFV